MHITLIYACVPLPLLQNAYQASKSQIYSHTYQITPEIQNLPFAMQILEHQNSYSLMVLGYEDYEDRLSFIDAQERIFTLIEGKAVASFNFDNNLEIKNPPRIKEIFLKLLKGEIKQFNHEALIRFTNPETSYLKLESHYIIEDKQNNFFKRRIDGKELAYYIFKERFYVPQIFWQGENIYWLTEDGEVLKSKQMLFPSKPKYFFETLKMYTKPRPKS